MSNVHFLFLLQIDSLIIGETDDATMVSYIEAHKLRLRFYLFTKTLTIKRYFEVFFLTNRITVCCLVLYNCLQTGCVFAVESCGSGVLLCET